MQQRIRHSVRLAAHGLLLALLVALGAVGPATALGNSSSDAKYCASLASRKQHIDAQLSTAQTGLRQSWQQQNDRYKIMVREQQSASVELFTSVDAQRAHNQQVLAKHGSANVERAIAVYQKAQQQALSQRRQSVKDANQEFTAAVQRLISDRQAAQAGQTEALRIAVDDALQMAVGQCATGVSGPTVAKNYRTRLQTVHQTFLDQRRHDSAISGQVADLAKARQESTDVTNIAYQAAMARAREVLLQSLGNKN